MYDRTANMDIRGGCVEVLCDLTVAAMALDTPEAAEQFGALSRFYWRADSRNGGTDAGCILCTTPTVKYNAPSYALTEQERALRTDATTQNARSRDNRQELRQRGEHLYYWLMLLVLV